MVECDRCHKYTKRTIISYWGHVLCGGCAREVAEMNDLLGTWPELPNEWKAV